jgi:PKD repeat protein
MNRILLMLFSLMVSYLGFSAHWVGITSPNATPAKTDLVSSTSERSTVHFSLDGFFLKSVRTQRGEAFTVSVGKGTPILVAGAPDLPKLTASVIIPDLAGMKVRVVSSSFKDFPGMEIAPSKGIIMRTINPSDLPFTYGRSYSQNNFFPEKIADLREPHIVRDFRGQTILVYPFFYNPVTKVLRVYYDITVEVFKDSNAGINPLTRKDKEIRVSKEFSAFYSRHFLNPNMPSYTPVNDFGKMLVITYGSFIDAIRPYVNWKNSIGYSTKLVDVATIGTTSAAIKNYISAYYSAHSDLAFVLLVGDNPQIPTCEGSGLGGPSDNAYGYLAGNDHYEDVFIGRFSAETVAQVQTQVTRTIDYEKNPQFISDDWYKTVLGIASDQGPGDDDEYDFEHIRNQQTQLLGYTYSVNPELFDGSQGGNDGSGDPTPAMVTADVNAGTGLILYCGHGSEDGWGTSGFSNTDVNNLANQGKLPFVWSVACVNGDFVDGTCFAESWLRASQGGHPTGAIAFLGSTINQSWDSPMCGQDEMTDILAESYPANIKRTFAGLSLNGCMKMIDEYGTDGENMADTWTVFGDPTLQVRTSMPGTLVVTNDPTVFVGATTLHVTCNVNGARASVSLNDSLLSTGIVANQVVNLTFPALSMPGDSLHLVVTAYNHIPFITDIPIITSNSPYVVYTSNHVNDTTGNNNHLADYDENILLTLYMENVGVLPTAGDVTVKLRSADPYITLSDTTANYGILAPNQTKPVIDGFAFHVSNQIPDLHPVSFTVLSSDGTSSWNSGFSITGHAPVLAFNQVSVNDSAGNNNHRLDPGESAFLKIGIINTGSAEAFNAAATLVSVDPYVTLLEDQKTYGNINGGTIVWRSFLVKVDSLAPQGQTAPFFLEITADKGIHASEDFSLVIGQVPVLIIDLDENQTSGPEMRTAVQELGVNFDYTISVPGDSLRNYSCVFVCLGVYPSNQQLSAEQGDFLAAYLNQGGRLYLEGGDTWYYDPQTAVQPMFHIVPEGDGSNDLGKVDGAAGTFTAGLKYSYSGENQFIDRIDAGDGAFVIFSNEVPAYHSAVAYDAGTYKTIGASFEFAGLNDTIFPSTKKNLMEKYLNFFGIQPPPLQANFIGFPTNVAPGGTVSFTDFSSGGITSRAWSFPGGTPSVSGEQNPVVTYNTEGNYNVQLIIGNGVSYDTLIRTAYIHVDEETGMQELQGLQCTIFPNPASGILNVRLSSAVEDNVGFCIVNSLGNIVYAEKNVVVREKSIKSLDLRSLPEGIYYLRIFGNDSLITRKIILQK